MNFKKKTTEMETKYIVIGQCDTPDDVIMRWARCETMDDVMKSIDVYLSQYPEMEVEIYEVRKVEI